MQCFFFFMFFAKPIFEIYLSNSQGGHIGEKNPQILSSCC